MMDQTLVCIFVLKTCFCYIAYYVCSMPEIELILCMSKQLYAHLVTHANDSRESKASVCLHDRTKMAETTITKLATDSPL